MAKRRKARCPGWAERLFFLGVFFFSVYFWTLVLPFFLNTCVLTWFGPAAPHCLVKNPHRSYGEANCPKLVGHDTNPTLPQLVYEGRLERSSHAGGTVMVNQDVELLKNRLNTDYADLSREDQDRILSTWNNATELGRQVLADMLAERNEKNAKFRKATKTALIAVHTVDRRLGLVLLNFRQVLPEDWRIQIFHSPETAEWVSSLQEVRQVRASLHNILPANLTERTIANFFVSREFWNAVEGDHVLTFQTDTVLCANSPFKIQDFMVYDYIGSPWATSPGACGSTALSLRYKPTMMTGLDICDRWDVRQEDEWVCKCMRDLPRHQVEVNRPTHMISRYFSVETILTEMPFGLHAPGKHYPAGDARPLFGFCPEAVPIKDTPP